MDQYQHIINVIIVNSELLKLQMGNQKEADKKYDEIIKWFKDSYIVSRKK